MGGKASRDKGARGEREVIKLLQPAVEEVYAYMRQAFPGAELGEVPFLQRNSLQTHKGGADIAGLPWLALEIKFHETPKVPEWWKQTLAQCRPGQLPVLIYRRSGGRWQVRLWTMPVLRLREGVMGTMGESSNQLIAADIDIADFIVHFKSILYSELVVKCKR